MRPAIVFLGPTLPAAEARAAVDAIFLPPAVQGSIVAAVEEFDPCAILLIDGGFQTVPAVRHREILWAISNGIPVVGAASMGALRAAELFPFMQGVGSIYRWYRRFAYAPDDAVAVLHGPEEIGHAPLTDALVDLRLTFKAARRRRLIDADLARALETAAGRLNFRDRTLARIVRDALPEASPRQREDLLAALRTTYVNRKREDALQALLLLRSGRYRPASPLPAFRVTAAFLRDLDDAGIALPAGGKSS